MNEQFTSRLYATLRASVSVFCLGWVVYLIKHSNLMLSWNFFESGFPHYILFALLFFAAIYVTRLFRLKHWIQCHTKNSISWTAWVDLYLKSISFGSVTPARLGDFSRIRLLAETGLPLNIRARLVLNEKLSDLLYLPIAICLTSSIVSQKLGLNTSWIITFGTLAFLFLLVLSGFFIEMPLGKVAFGWLLTVLGFCLYILGNVFLFWSVDIDLPVLDITAIIISVGVIVNIPISINGIGLREGSLMAILGFWGVPISKIPPVLVLEFFFSILYPILLYGLFLIVKKSHGN